MIFIFPAGCYQNENILKVSGELIYGVLNIKIPLGKILFEGEASVAKFVFVMEYFPIE